MRYVHIDNDYYERDETTSRRESPTMSRRW